MHDNVKNTYLKNFFVSLIKYKNIAASSDIGPSPQGARMAMQSHTENWKKWSTEDEESVCKCSTFI